MPPKRRSTYTWEYMDSRGRDHVFAGPPARAARKAANLERPGSMKVCLRRRDRKRVDPVVRCYNTTSKAVKPPAGLPFRPRGGKIRRAKARYIRKNN